MPGAGYARGQRKPGDFSGSRKCLVITPRRRWDPYLVVGPRWVGEPPVLPCSCSSIHQRKKQNSATA